MLISKDLYFQMSPVGSHFHAHNYFPFPVLLAILARLFFHLKWRISLSSSNGRKTVHTFIRNTLINVLKFAHTSLHLPIEKHGISICSHLMLTPLSTLKLFSISFAYLSLFLNIYCSCKYWFSSIMSSNFCCLSIWIWSLQSHHPERAGSRLNLEPSNFNSK